jgi:hypothetical protein
VSFLRVTLRRRDRCSGQGEGRRSESPREIKNGGLERMLRMERMQELLRLLLLLPLQRQLLLGVRRIESFVAQP